MDLSPFFSGKVRVPKVYRNCGAGIDFFFLVLPPKKKQKPQLRRIDRLFFKKNLTTRRMISNKTAWNCGTCYSKLNNPFPNFQDHNLFFPGKWHVSDIVLLHDQELFFHDFFVSTHTWWHVSARLPGLIKISSFFVLVIQSRTWHAAALIQTAKRTTSCLTHFSPHFPKEQRGF